MFTPSPRAHALYANKRNLVVLSDAGALRAMGVPDDVVQTLPAAVPRTVLVSAANAEETLSILDSNSGIALLLTDVVLGRGMDGVALALEAKRRHPRLKVLCMSGHAETEIFERYKGADQLRLVAKPFSRSTLSEVIEEVLSTDQHAAAG